MLSNSTSLLQHLASCLLWEQSKMKFSSILSEINGFGKFQIQLVLIQLFSRITLPCHFLLNNFMAAVPSHHCNTTALDEGGDFRNLTLEQRLAVGIPTELDGTPSSCLMFSKPQYQHLSGLNSSEDTFTVQCQDGWVYDNRTFKSTLATEVSVFDKSIISCFVACMLYLNVVFFKDTKDKRPIS